MDIVASMFACESLSVVPGSATPWTVACQAPLSMVAPGQNARVGSRSLLQGIFPTQGLNPGLTPCRQILYHLRHKGSPSAAGNTEVHVSFQIMFSLAI